MLTRGSNFRLSCLVVALLAIVNTTSGTVEKIKPSSRIVNGTIISIEEAPYMVQLRHTNKFTCCGGTLISLQHVVTAAHCVEDPIMVRGMTVVGGASLRREKGVERKIAKIFIHPERNKSLRHADVAVLKLDMPFEQGEKIKPQTKFCSTPPNVGEYVKVTGWGAKKSSSVLELRHFKEDDYSKELRKVRVPIISNDDCRQRIEPIYLKYFHSTPKLSSTTICAYKEHYDICKTDSGGPGFYEDKFCTIVSWAIGCAYGSPAVYTSVSTVLDFITEKLKE